MSDNNKWIQNQTDEVNSYRARTGYSGCLRMIHYGPTEESEAELVNGHWVVPYQPPIERADRDEPRSKWAWVVLHAATGLSLGDIWDYREAAVAQAEALPTAEDLAVIASADSPRMDERIKRARQVAEQVERDTAKSARRANGGALIADELRIAEIQLRDAEEELDEAQDKLDSFENLVAELRAELAAVRSEVSP